MFGYINIYKDELKVKEYNTYRAYYCGLCKELGRNHNVAARFALNYDLTFLAILADSIVDLPHDFYMSGCIKKIGKRKTVRTSSNLEFVSDMNVLLAYFNLKDDIKDDGSFKARLAILPFIIKAKKLRKKYPELYQTIDIALSRLSFIEDMQTDIIDKAAHEFATIMKTIFNFCDESISDFGYQLGRLIYAMDAFDDMKDDYHAKKYNPAVLCCRYEGVLTDEIKEYITHNLYNTLAVLSQEYDKIKIIKNKELLDNIIYLGIRARCDDIINERKNKNEKSV